MRIEKKHELYIIEMSDENEERAKQLEEARKRVEELKNKKKKKGKKKAKKDQTPELEQTAESQELTEENKLGNESSQNEKGNSTSLEEDLKTEGLSGGNAEKVDIKGEAREDALEESKDEPPANSNTEESEEFEAETLGKPTTETGTVPETGPGSCVQEKQTEGEELQNQIEDGEPQKQDDVDDLFSGDGQEQDFLSSLQKEKDNALISDLQKQVEELNSQLKKLKFVNMDQETAIEELNEKVSQLEGELASTSEELVHTKQELASTIQTMQESQQQLSRARVIDENPSRTSLQFSQFTSASPKQMSPQPQQAQPHTVDRATLSKWQNWNVDMTNWRSIGAGPIVEF